MLVGVGRVSFEGFGKIVKICLFSCGSFDFVQNTGSEYVVGR
jgi:hypothetical protein